jgi:hypothetical protein
VIIVHTISEYWFFVCKSKENKRVLQVIRLFFDRWFFVFSIWRCQAGGFILIWNGNGGVVYQPLRPVAGWMTAVC